MIPDLDPLLDFGCPHCGTSLRWRRVRWRPRTGGAGRETPLACPACDGNLILNRHPALADNWLWSRFYLPGVALCMLGIFVPALGWLLPYAVAVLGLGFTALVAYMIRERWNWKRFLPHPEDSSSAAPPEPM